MTSNCEVVISAAMGRPVTEDELERITEAVQQRIKQKMRDGASAREAAKVAAGEMTAEAALRKSLARRTAFENIVKFRDLEAREVAGKEVQVSRSVLSGYAASGLRNMGNSIDALREVFKNNLFDPAVAALKKAGLMDALKNGDRDFNLRVAKEIRRLDDPTLEADTGDKHAKAAAKILGDMMEASRAMQNKAGGFIGKLDGYMGRQFHDMMKVRGDFSEAAFKVWRDAISPGLDLDKMYPDLDALKRNSALRDTWQALATGVHDTSTSEALGGFGGANLGTKVSQNRSIIFKDAQSWFDYNEKFGKGSVIDAAFHSAEGAARDSAIMTHLGTNPTAMWNKWQQSMMQKAYDRGDAKAGDALKNKETNKHLFENVAGGGHVVANFTGATIGATVRQSMQLIHLGQILGSATSHTFINAELMRHNGGDFWSGLAQQIRAWVPYGAAQKEIATALQVASHHDVGLMTQRFRTEDGPAGMMAKAVNQFHQWNGFGWYMDQQKAAIGMGLSNRLAYHAGKEFAALDPMMQTSLRRYGIEAPEWDIGRAVAAKEADGNHYVIPANIADAGVQTKFKTFITDTVREGMNEPTPWARQAATFNTKAGTWGGEFIRAFMQFKSFGLTMMERQAGRMIRDGGRAGFDIPGSLYMIGGMTVAGYMGLTLRGIIANQTPRLPTDASGWAALVRDAAVAGGGLGLYGDVLVRGGERSAGDMIKGLAGPAPSTVADAIFGAKHVAEGATKADRKTIALQEGQKVLGDLTPNHPFIAAANSFLLGHMFREMVSPGATRRYNNLLREKGQGQVLRPALQN